MAQQQDGQAAVLAVRGDRVEVGDWSADLSQVIATDVELRGMLREGRTVEARALMHARCDEEQAALVAIDSNPEEVLSLTAMDEAGRPGYEPRVVDRLPTAVLTDLIAPSGTKLVRFNTGVLATMSPDTFTRTVDDTLDPIYHHSHRSQVSWEWLSAVAALDDVNKIAQLLWDVGPSLLEDALLERVDDFGMNDTSLGIPGFRTVSESGGGLMLPPMKDGMGSDVLATLHAAAPELLADAIRSAWEQSGALR